MRPVIQAIYHELDGVRFFAADYFDERGQLADNVIQPVDHIVGVRRIIADLMKAHGANTVDMYTDDDGLFKAFMPVVGVNVQFDSAAGLSGLYAHFRSDSPQYRVIRELWIPQAESAHEDEQITEEIEMKRPSIWRRIIKYIKGLFNR